ncbi:MAG: helix-turn-helix domain-containing protein [Deltaproteobacteria bacterium]|jgi:DNA-binding XRE family transcriptional regulator|nr:helix-turn-helix domain-containing protein [Deltaproteobacteria bacterium]
MRINGPAFARSREELLLGLAELANKADVTYKTLVRVERGQSVKVISLRKIIRALGMTIQEAIAKKLIEFDEEEEPMTH